jgi:hypothetical protein
LVRKAGKSSDTEPAGKGSASLLMPYLKGDTFDIDFVAHEILGHHSELIIRFLFEIEDNEMRSRSGSTIMAYAGITVIMSGNNSRIILSQALSKYKIIYRPRHVQVQFTNSPPNNQRRFRLYYS